MHLLGPEAEIGDLIIEVRSATTGAGSYTTKFEADVAQGRITHLGPQDLAHAWAWLPDLAQVSFFASTDRTMVAQVPVKHVATIYTAFGRWFEWVCLFGFLVILARALFARRQIN